MTLEDALKSDESDDPSFRDICDAIKNAKMFLDVLEEDSASLSERQLEIFGPFSGLLAQDYDYQGSFDNLTTRLRFMGGYRRK